MPLPNKQAQLPPEVKQQILDYLEDHTPPTGKQFLALMAWTILAGVLAIIMHGIALKLCWDWFMVPLFGLPSLPVMGAIGVSIVGRAFVGNKPSPTKQSSLQSYKKSVEEIANMLKSDFSSAIGLVMISWIISMFL